MAKSMQIEKIQPSLPPERAAQLIKRQIDQIDGLLELAYNDPEVRKWDNMTEQILIKSFGKPHDNLSDFFSARHGGVVRMGMYPDELQLEYQENLTKCKKLLEGFIEQLDLFAEPIIDKSQTEDKKDLSKKVFIVHGHDDTAKSELALIISSLGFEPIILHEQANEGMTLIEKLEKHSDVGYAFILLTPDDVGSSANQRENLHARARQNVVFEFGLFAGKLGRNRVCCIYKGDIELPSDLHGLVYIPFTNSINEKQIDIIRELKAAGYQINI